MGKTTFRRSNRNKPAPKMYRRFENAMLTAIIPATVLVLQGWGFQNDLIGTRAILIIGTALVAVIKGVGMMLSNGQDYVDVTPTEEKEDDNG